MDGIVKRLPVKGKDGSIDLIEIEGIFYLEAKGHDTLIRTRRKKPYLSVQRIQELARKLPAPAFVRCHREYIVNLNRVRSLTAQIKRLRPAARSPRQPPDSHRTRAAEKYSQHPRRVTFTGQKGDT